MTVIEQVKILLGLDDDLQDNLLEVIKTLTEAHFKAYTQQISIPNDLSYIIVEVVVKRFNKLGSEGVSSQSVEGLSMTFEMNDFQAYSDVLKRYYSDDFGAGFQML